MRHGKGIHRRVIIDEIRSPQLDDLPQLTVEVITKQGRQRSVFIENGLCCWRLIIRNHFILKCLNPLITIDVLVIHMIHVEAAFFIDIDDCAALVIFFFLVQLLQQYVHHLQDIGGQQVAMSSQ